MYNLRYHIASLVAVFLALALGLVLGGIVVERGTLDAQRAAIVKSLRDDFVELKAENAVLRRDLGLESQFADAAATDVVAGRLDGKRVVVVANEGRTDALQAARSAIEDAGGEVALVTVRGSGLSLDDEDVRKSLSADEASDAPAPEVASVVTSLSVEWGEGAVSRPVTDALVDAGAISVQGLDAGTAAQGIVVVAASDGKPDAAIVGLARAFQTAGVASVGGEALAQQTGVAAAAAEAGIGAVNVIDTASGRWSLIELLSGGSPAFYGVGNDVDAPFPPLPPVQTTDETTTTR